MTCLSLRIFMVDLRAQTAKVSDAIDSRQVLIPRLQTGAPRVWCNSPASSRGLRIVTAATQGLGKRWVKPKIPFQTIVKCVRPFIIRVYFLPFVRAISHLQRLSSLLLLLLLWVYALQHVYIYIQRELNDIIHRFSGDYKAEGARKKSYMYGSNN